jgi:hypothetical protein
MSRLTLLREEAEEHILPPICAVCGSSAPKLKSVHFAWAPNWTHAVLVFSLCVGIWPWLIVRLVTHRGCDAHMPLCNMHWNYWTKRRLLMPLGIFASLGSLVLYMLFSNDGQNLSGWFLLVPFALLLGSLAIGGILLVRGSRVVEITSRDMTMAGLHPTFLAAVEAGRAEYRKHREEWLTRRDRKPESDPPR